MFLALDQGGHASRAFVFDRAGRVVRAAFRRIATEHPGPARVEHDPIALVHSLREAAREAVAALGPRRSELKAAGLATQRSSLVCWDTVSGVPSSPVLSWQDTRAATWLSGLEGERDWVHERTGLFLSAHYGASKLRWCLDHLEEVRRARDQGRLAWGPLASYLLDQLSSAAPFITDPANAQRTLLWNLSTQDWDLELREFFGVTDGQLPRCRPSIGELGTLGVDDHEIPLTALTGDQSAAVFAFGPPPADVAYLNVGTGAFVQIVGAGSPARHPRLLTSILFSSEKESRWSLEGSVNGAGAALRRISAELEVHELEPVIARGLAGKIEPVLFLNGVSGLASPYWQPGFNSRFVGEGDVAQKLLAVLESIIFLVHMNLETMRPLTAPLSRIVITGGLSRWDALCQRLSDLTGLPVERPPEVEATARGLAWILAGSPGHWPATSSARRFDPTADPRLHERFERWRELMPSPG